MSESYYSFADEAAFPTEMSIVLNTASPLIAKLAETVGTDKEKSEAIASYIYKVCLLSQKKLSADEMQSFLDDSFNILLKL